MSAGDEAIIRDLCKNQNFAVRFSHYFFHLFWSSRVPGSLPREFPRPPGGLLGASCGVSEASWEVLGGLWEPLGQSLGPLWDSLCNLWRHLGGLWGLLGAIWVPKRTQKACQSKPNE